MVEPISILILGCNYVKKSIIPMISRFVAVEVQVDIDD